MPSPSKRRLSTRAAAAAAGTTENIRVLLRVRPEDERQLQHGGAAAHRGAAGKSVRIASAQTVVVQPDPLKEGRDHLPSSPSSPSKHQPKAFTFDQVFGPRSTQDQIYAAVDPLVESAVRGYNATVFAYGATGSGKTHTISGSEGAPGVIPRAVERIFELANSITAEQTESMVLVHMTFVELYNNRFRDLLAQLGLQHPSAHHHQPAHGHHSQSQPSRSLL